MGGCVWLLVWRRGAVGFGLVGCAFGGFGFVYLLRFLRGVLLCCLISFVVWSFCFLGGLFLRFVAVWWFLVLGLGGFRFAGLAGCGVGDCCDKLVFCVGLCVLGGLVGVASCGWFVM